MDKIIIQQEFILKDVDISKNLILVSNGSGTIHLPAELCEFTLFPNMKITYFIKERSDKTRYFELSAAPGQE